MRVIRKVAAVAAGAIAVAGAYGLSIGLQPSRSATAAGTSSLPGMCTGRNDPNLVIVAHANGKPGAIPKFILNTSTDGAGRPSGGMSVYRGPDNLTVSDFCRAWQHIQGQSSGGDCETSYPVGATTAHVVGLGQMKGVTMLVRADVRKTLDGQLLFRLRYRPWPSIGETAVSATDEGECGDASWTWLPGEEQWAPLDQLMIRTSG